MTDRNLFEKEETLKNMRLELFFESECTIFLHNLEKIFISLANETNNDLEIKALTKLIEYVTDNLFILRSMPLLNEKMIKTFKELKEDNKHNVKLCELCDVFLAL